MSDDKEIRNASIGLRFFPSIKEAIEKAAKEDRRTVSALIEKIVVEWLKAKGYLKP